MPGWTWVNEDTERSQEEIDDITPTLDALASEWSQITSEIEREGFRRQASIEDGDYDGRECETEDCNPRKLCKDCKEMNRQQRQREAVKEVKLEVIENMLAKYGARVMRPYEHWNEDERYMEYMENRSNY